MADVLLVERAVAAQVCECTIRQRQRRCTRGRVSARATLVPSSTCTMPKKPTGLRRHHRVVRERDHRVRRKVGRALAAAAASPPAASISSRIH